MTNLKHAIHIYIYGEETVMTDERNIISTHGLLMKVECGENIELLRCVFQSKDFCIK
jgi:hypothetical protein